jgi:hypothetical protein
MGAPDTCLIGGFEGLPEAMGRSVAINPKMLHHQAHELPVSCIAFENVEKTSAGLACGGQDFV